jgi:hypothetical protein
MEELPLKQQLLMGDIETQRELWDVVRKQPQFREVQRQLAGAGQEQLTRRLFPIPVGLPSDGSEQSGNPGALAEDDDGARSVFDDVDWEPPYW